MVRITAAELAATKAKLAKINDRAAKRGFTGRLELSVTKVEETTTDELTGLPRTNISFEVGITGEAPKYDGWTFLATLDWDPHAGLIVRSIPGAPEVNQDGLKPGWCDHCRTNRHRKETYLVRHDDGRELQVGSSCIKDFLGHQAQVSLFYSDDVASELGFGGFGFNEPDAVDTRHALAVAYALIKLDGYLPASNFGQTTKGDVLNFLWPPRSQRQERHESLARIRSLADEAIEQADACIAWVLSEFNGTGNYANNLRAIVGADYVTANNIGILASAPQAWAKAQQRTLIEESRGVSNWLGEEGKKITFTATINGISYVSTAYGSSTLYTLRTKDGDVVKWFSTAGALGDITGKDVTLTATVKKHETFRDIKQTLVTRAKVAA